MTADPQIDPVLDRARAYFDEFAGEYDKAATEATWLPNDLLAEDLPAIGPVGHAADLACGTGRTLEVLRHAYPGADLVGVDFSTTMLEIARNRVGDVWYVHADVASFVAACDQEFDLVTVIGGFEFVADLPTVLQGVRAVVRPGGHLLVTYEPVIACWQPQSARVETNLGSNGLDLTTFRWEPGEIELGFDGWLRLHSRLVVAYQRDGLPTIYGWLHYQRPI